VDAGSEDPTGRAESPDVPRDRGEARLLGEERETLGQDRGGRRWRQQADKSLPTRTGSSGRDAPSDAGSRSRPRLILPLKWPGGKTQVLPRLREVVALLGGLTPNQTYHAPFAGAGALFHDLAPAQARLNDAAPALVNCLQAIKADPGQVYLALDKLVKAFPPHTDRPAQVLSYNATRGKFNARVKFSPSTSAAQMIFLNRTCFNGLWRVNIAGGFNASLGKYTAPAFPSLEDLRAISVRLQAAVISLGDFSTALDAAREGDLAFLDPPYGGVRGDSGFVGYTAGGFDGAQQRWLVEVIRILHDRGVRIILTNGAFPGNREAYEAAGLHVEKLAETRTINTKVDARGTVPCLLAWTRDGD
jgi:DNA adenine methylase